MAPRSKKSKSVSNVVTESAPAQNVNSVHVATVGDYRIMETKGGFRIRYTNGTEKSTGTIGSQNLAFYKKAVPLLSALKPGSPKQVVVKPNSAPDKNDGISVGSPYKAAAIVACLPEIEKRMAVKFPAPVTQPVAASTAGQITVTIAGKEVTGSPDASGQYGIFTGQNQRNEG